MDKVRHLHFYETFVEVGRGQSEQVNVTLFRNSLKVYCHLYRVNRLSCVLSNFQSSILGIFVSLANILHLKLFIASPSYLVTPIVCILVRYIAKYHFYFIAYDLVFHSIFLGHIVLYAMYYYDFMYCTVSYSVLMCYVLFFLLHYLVSYSFYVI